MFGGLSFKKKGKKKKKLSSAGPAFGEEKDDDGVEKVTSAAETRAEVTARMTAQGRKAQLKAQKEYEKIVSVDPTAFQFDEFHDKTQSQPTTKNGTDALGNNDSREGKEKQAHKSKYIEQLLASSRQREFEYEKAMERVIHKEQLEEEKEFGKASEVFVTGAYKKRLEERRLWEIEEKKRAEIEAMNDVTKRGDLTGFYSGMLGQLSRAPEPEKQKQPPSQESGATHENENPASKAKANKEISSEAPSGNVIQETPEVNSTNKKESNNEVKIYRPGDMKRKREEESIEEKKAPATKVSTSALEAARQRALARKRQKEGA
mmetsp:Transcript_1423/g.1827  ORF Transcript_1423/g.1827 Transcript_1423/m.1827 type:complete len:319 (+) Transcript_1423:49-1005(+)